MDGGRRTAPYGRVGRFAVLRGCRPTVLPRDDVEAAGSERKVLKRFTMNLGALELDPEDLAGPVEGVVHDLLGPVLTGALTFEGTPGRPPSFFIRRLTQINADFIIVLQVRGASIQCVKICAKLRNLRISRPHSVLPHHPRPNPVATSGCTRCPGHPGWDRSVATGVDAGSNYGSASRCRTGTDPPCAREDRWPATAFGRVPHQRSRPTLAVALTSRSSQDRCPCAWLALCQTGRWVVS